MGEASIDELSMDEEALAGGPLEALDSLQKDACTKVKGKLKSSADIDENVPTKRKSKSTYTKRRKPTAATVRNLS